jgi:hypothetical protein
MMYTLFVTQRYSINGTRERHAGGARKSAMKKCDDGWRDLFSTHSVVHYADDAASCCAILVVVDQVLQTVHFLIIPKKQNDCSVS